MTVGHYHEVVIESPTARRLGGIERAVQLVYFVAGSAVALLGLRFTLLAMGANQANSFAQLILTLSAPLAAPFLSLFGHNPAVGNARLEFPLLVAMFVYALLALFIAKTLRLMFAPNDPTGSAYRNTL